MSAGPGNKNARKHGWDGTPTHRAWINMRYRCLTPTCSFYDRYGGRGIIICERWDSFEMFLSDMGPRPDGASLDRIDNNGRYEPNNCRWATRSQQQQNKNNNANITWDGETLCVSVWAKRLGMKLATLRKRLRAWGVEDAFFAPIDVKKQAGGVIGNRTRWGSNV